MATKFPARSFPFVYLISDGMMTDETFVRRSERFLKLVLAAVEARVSAIQIREKQLSAKNVFLLTNRVAQITRDAETLLLVNDRADIALAAQADGVHLTSNSLYVSVVRQAFPASFTIGVSAHSLSEVNQAKYDGANFATFSPIYATPSKCNLPPQGIKKLKEVCHAVGGFPVIALGGIAETNAATVLQAGASGLAAIRFLSDPKTLPTIVKTVRNDLQNPKSEI